MNKNNKGFTLVELLVVIAIIGILAAVVAPNAFRAIEKSKVARTINDMKAFKTAALAFYADVGFFPADPTGGSPDWYRDPGLGASPVGDYSPQSIAALGFASQSVYLDRVNSRWQGPYLDFPTTKRTAWGGRYDYECWGPGVGRANGVPDGIYITIHEITRENAELLVELSPFEVARGTGSSSGGIQTDDVASGMYKVTLKISDWLN